MKDKGGKVGEITGVVHRLGMEVSCLFIQVFARAALDALPVGNIFMSRLVPIASGLTGFTSAVSPFTADGGLEEYGLEGGGYLFRSGLTATGQVTKNQVCGGLLP